MTQTITLPDLWLLIAPCGCYDGFMRSTHEGEVTRANPEAAWKWFAPLKRERERMVKSGYVLRGGDFEEWNSRENKGDCPHDPQWTAPAVSTSTEEP
jgi:hypothetical protein